MPQQITSAQNSFIKQLIRLNNEREYRYELGQFLVEGTKALAQATGLQMLVFAEGAESSISMLSIDSLIPQVVVPEKLFKRISVTETPQGILGVCQLSYLPEIPPQGKFVYLAGIQDPGNAGTIIRSAAAFNFDGVIFGPGTCDPFSPKVVRSTMGAIFSQKIILAKSQELLSGRYLICADSSGKRLDLEKLPSNFILVIGAESQGVPIELKKQAQQIVAVPISRQVESLNAAVAAGILMYQLGV